MNKFAGVLAGVVTLGCIVPAAAQAGGSEIRDYARVVSKSEIVEEVPVQKKICRTVDETVESSGRSPAGAIIGGVAGGVLGHTVGKGSGKQAATAVGAIAGAIIGDRIGNRDAGGSVTTRPVERCEVAQDYEERVVGYRVTYEYDGKRYTTRMDKDPGREVELRISVVGGEDYNERVTYREPPRRHREWY